MAPTLQYCLLALLAFSICGCKVSFSSIEQNLEESFRYSNQQDFCRYDKEKSKKQLHKALDQYKDYYSQYCTYDDSVAIWNNQGVRLALIGKYEKAQEKWSRAMAAEDNPTMDYNMALSYLLAGKADSSKLFWGGTTGDASFPHAAYNELVADVQQKQQGGELGTPMPGYINSYAYANSYAARDAYSAILEATQDPCNCLAWQRKGMLELRDSAYAEAAQSFLQASEVGRCQNANLLHYGMVKLHLGEPELAEEAFQEIEGQFRAERAYGLGMAHYDLEEYRAARRYFKRAVGIDNELAEGFVGLGNVAIEMGDYDNAMLQFSKALKLEPKLPAALLGKAICIYEYTKDKFDFFTSIQLQEALDLLDEIKDSDKNRQLVFQKNVLQGFVLLKSSLFGASLSQQQYRQITRSFEIALSIRPSHVPSLVGIALTEDQLGNLGRSQIMLDQAIGIESENPHLYNIKASLLYNHDEYEPARQSYQRAYQLDTINREALNGLGITNRKLMQYPSSIHYLDKVVQVSKGEDFQDEYINNLAISTYYHALDLEDNYLRDSSQVDLDSAIYYYQKSLSDLNWAFDLENDSTYILNMASIVGDSCIGRFQKDSIVVHFYLNGGQENGRFIANNMGVLYALRDSNETARELFVQANTPRDPRYATPMWNLERLGEKMSKKEQEIMRTERAKSMRLRDRDGFIYTLLYHYNYLYRFELYDQLPNYHSPIYLETDPEPIIDFRLIECENEKEKPNKPKRALVGNVKKKSRGYKAGGKCFDWKG